MWVRLCAKRIVTRQLPGLDERVENSPRQTNGRMPGYDRTLWNFGEQRGTHARSSHDVCPSAIVSARDNAGHPATSATTATDNSGSILYSQRFFGRYRFGHDPVAQWIERPFPKREVACSTHAGVARITHRTGAIS
jgi:hypothetical protein